MASPEHDLVTTVAAARREPGLAVLEGFHPVKHALRFGARPQVVVAAEGTSRGELPPELAGHEVTRVDPDTFARLVRSRPRVPLVAVARRPGASLRAALSGAGPVVLLERPNHPGNTGAVVRVAAAACAAGVVTVGGVDPWGAAALRGGAGLQFALPVVRTGSLPETDRPVIAFDPEGVALDDLELPRDALLAFGTELRGISPALRDAADTLVRIPMHPLVSSLNLATAVAVALYSHPRGC